MNDQSHQSLVIDAALQARLAALAEKSGQNLAELAEKVLRRHADEAERDQIEQDEDERRWQRFLADGRSVSFERVHENLRSRVPQSNPETGNR